MKKYRTAIIKTLVLMIIHLGFNLTSFSQTNNQEYFFGVFAQNVNFISNSPSPGHAFIGIGKGTPLVCSTDGSETEAWGFYPEVRIEGALSYIFGPVPSLIKDDIYTRNDHQYFIKISFSDYIKVLAKIEEWKERQYELTRNDCISFVIDCCSIFGDRLIVPNRMNTDTPEIYIKRFIDVNKM